MNEGESELLAAVARIIRVFDELGVDYLVGGSLASSAPRTRRSRTFWNGSAIILAARH